VFSTSDTIVAVATPPGRGGLGVVRISGRDARQIVSRLLDPDSLEPRQATFARVVDPNGSGGARVVDEVVATWFQAPRSYTREDVVEIAAHGSPVVLERLVALAVGAGARLAEPGEFTLRAYLNGRIDLVQAEAVADLIDAVTPSQARAAMDQLEGTLTGKIAAIGARLFDLAARLEASIDFPEEGFHFVTRDATRAELEETGLELSRLGREGASGRLIREGATVVILGRPNAGKSSLFNALVGADRAIVTEIAGTTRDVVTERVDFDGVPITLVDTAGIREARDIVEAEGIRRTHQAAAVAAVTVVVIDGSGTLTLEDNELVARSSRTVVARSKTDLPGVWSTSDIAAHEVVAVSATRGTGIAELRAAILRVLTAGETLRDTPSISNARHLALVERAELAVNEAQLVVANGGSEEEALVEIGIARNALEELTGRTTDEDLLRHIFGRFCVGK
jgi:tRNA modification GTPase